MTIKDRTTEVWTSDPAGTTFSKGATPGTKAFFINVFKQRSEVEQPWLFELIPFATTKRKEVLEIGCGAGYDAYVFCQNGASYTGIDITPVNPERTRKHLSYYELEPRVSVGDAEYLMFTEQHFDMVYSNGVLHHTPDIRKSFQEIYRVLSRNGDFWVILYHKNSIFYWLSLWLAEYLLKFQFRHQSFKERLAKIEYTTSESLPLVNVYSRTELEEMLTSTGFTVEAIHVRKLLRDDLPDLPVVRRLYPLVPQWVLDSLGALWGWYIIAHAKKPDSPS